MACCLLYKNWDPQPGKAQSCTGLRRQWCWGSLFTVRQGTSLEKEGVLVKPLWAYYLGRALWKAFYCKQRVQKFVLLWLLWMEGDAERFPPSRSRASSFPVMATPRCVWWWKRSLQPASLVGQLPEELWKCFMPTFTLHSKLLIKAEFLLIENKCYES